MRALHGWGSNFMVAIVLIHMVQVFLFGAYKFPRELTWIVGVFLLLMTLGMAFTGQVLRFDQDAYWGLGIGASIASRVPVSGRRREADAGRPDHRRRDALPILRAARVRDSRVADRLRRPSRADGAEARHQRMADARTRGETRDLPARISRVDEEGWRAVRSRMPSGRTCSSPAFILLAVAACALYFGPFGPTGKPDPTIIQTVPKPDYFFLWLYALLSLLPPSLETPACSSVRSWSIVGAASPAVPSGEGEKSWKRRPIAVLTVLLIAVTLGTFTHLAEFAPWSPHMNAWSGDPVPAAIAPRHDRAGAARRARVSGQAVPQLPRARRRAADSAVRRSTASPCG